MTLKEIKVQQQYLEVVDMTEAWAQRAYEHSQELLAYGANAEECREPLERPPGQCGI